MSSHRPCFKNDFILVVVAVFLIMMINATLIECSDIDYTYTRSNDDSIDSDGENYFASFVEVRKPFINVHGNSSLFDCVLI